MCVLIQYHLRPGLHKTSRPAEQPIYGLNFSLDNIFVKNMLSQEHRQLLPCILQASMLLLTSSLVSRLAMQTSKAELSSFNVLDGSTALSPDDLKTTLEA